MKKKIRALYICLVLGIGLSFGQFKAIYTATNTENIGGTLTLINNVLYGCSGPNAGDIYTVSVNGSNYNEIYHFGASGITDGEYPTGILMQSITNDTLFGMTNEGGVYNYGTIFSIGTNGSSYHKILDFNDTNGEYPNGGVIVAGHTLYGMTADGGAHNKGLLFSIQSNGSGFKDILDFDSINGAEPSGSLTFSTTGDTLFGMTHFGGANNHGCIFSVGKDGTGYQRLFDFTIINSNGGDPAGTLTLFGNMLYGMTSGSSADEGCIFYISTNGTGYKNLLSFNDTNGAFPYGNITVANGKLYGMTMQGGVNSGGVFFDIGTNGNTYQDLHDFSCATDKGSEPTGSITSSLTGDTLYGAVGGNYCSSGNDGFIFNYTSNTVGIKEIAPKNIVNVFPNPSNGVFNIKYSGIENRPSVAIYNMLGENVYSAQLNTATSQIDLGNNPLGVYLYRIINQDGNLFESGKLVKEQ